MRLCDSPCPPCTARSSFPQPGFSAALVDIPAFTHLATLRSTSNLGTLGHRNGRGDPGNNIIREMAGELLSLDTEGFCQHLHMFLTYLGRRYRHSLLILPTARVFSLWHRAILTRTRRESHGLEGQLLCRDLTTRPRFSCGYKLSISNLL